MAKDIYSSRRSMMAKITPKTAEQLHKESEDLYKEKIAKENHLIQMYEEKKLKSASSIRQAKAILEKRNSANKKDN